MFSKVFVLWILIFVSFDCAPSPSTISETQFQQLESQITSLLARPNPAEAFSKARQDLLDKGNTLKQNIERSAQPHRAWLGKAKTNLATYGAVTTGVGVITAILVGVYNPSDTKAGIGAGGAILTAIIGIYQAIDGAGKDKEAYVKSCDEATAEWTSAKKDPDPTISDPLKRETKAYMQTRLAYDSFYNKAVDIKKSFLDLADFQIP
jgi:hypothetical protein